MARTQAGETPSAALGLINRPLGTAPFREEGHLYTLYSLATHPELYDAVHPSHSTAERVIPDDGHAAHRRAHKLHHSRRHHPVSASAEAT